MWRNEAQVSLFFLDIVTIPPTTAKTCDNFTPTKIIAYKFAQLKSCIYICNLKVA